MKKRILPTVVPILAIGLGPGWLCAADTPYGSPSGSSPQESAPNTNPNPNANAPNSMATPGANDAAQALPADWSKAKGTVQAIDSATKEVKFKDENGMLSRVTIDPNVVIRKNGKKVEFTELKEGDRITLTRKKAPSEMSNKG